MTYCIVNPLDITLFTVLLEYINDNNEIQRCWLSRELFSSTRKNEPVLIPCNYLNLGITYSNVDLTLSLGEVYKDIIQVRDMEQAFRKADFWLREDYRKDAEGVNRVLIFNNWRKLIDATTVINAAHAVM